MILKKILNENHFLIYEVRFLSIESKIHQSQPEKEADFE